VAAEADDHTLYLMVPSPQTEEERAAERTWIPPLPLPAGVFDWQEKPGTPRLIPPLILPRFRTCPRSPVHRDKIGRGRDKSEKISRMGKSFQEESIGIRKPKQNRKIVKPRNRNMGTTPDREMAEGDFEDEIS
jgi:hypothetical protein